MGERQVLISGIRGDLNFISGIRGDCRKIILGRANKNIWGSREHWPKVPGIKGAGTPLPGPHQYFEIRERNQTQCICSSFQGFGTYINFSYIDLFQERGADGC